ncbi:MFS family permease [Lipingzhangella halophila]|uniref:MFS family permease n=1 Tax=Lipingzhangella halophila TaxID=1783352 RepID=A0A7W7W5U9_9ACTN|nr:MFS family permease [Lipingzhangella halophila]
MGVYFLAMFHRNGLAVAALEAQERFQMGPALLSVLPVMQLAVYVLLQLPAGLLADRLGPRRTLLIGLLAMTAGVVLFALAPGFQFAVAARVLIGLGDALVFLNVIRLGALWFPRGQYALISAFTGVIGGLGQVASVAPLSAALAGFGWTAAFLGAGGATVLMALLVLLVVRDRPAGAQGGPVAQPISIRASVIEAARARGPRVGMTNHVVIQAPYTMLAALWGYPSLVEGLGLPGPTASLALTVLGVATLWVAPVVGACIGRWPAARRPIAITAAVLVSVGWLAFVGWPGGPPPVPLVIAHFAVGAGATVMAAPLSFDFARDGIPSRRTGVASSLVNMCGFAVVVLTTVGAGAILEALPEPHGGAAYQMAFLPVATTSAIGTLLLVAQLWRYPVERR